MGAFAAGLVVMLALAVVAGFVLETVQQPSAAQSPVGVHVEATSEQS